jgi:hypothetical protein
LFVFVARVRKTSTITIHEHDDLNHSFSWSAGKIAPRNFWHPDGDVTLEGLKYNIQIYSEQTQSKGPPLTLAKYVDQSYLKEALRQLAAK